MHRNRIARERIDAEDVVAARRLALEREAAVAEDDLGLRRGVVEESELAPRDVHHARADLVEDQAIAGLHPGGDNAGAEADDAHGKRLLRIDLAQRSEDAPVARRRSEVVRGRIAERIAE